MTSTPPTSSIVLVDCRVARKDLRIGLKGRTLSIGHVAIHHVVIDHFCNPDWDFVSPVISQCMSGVGVV